MTGEKQALVTKEDSQIAQPDNMLAIINTAAQNPEVDVDKMRALLDMKKEIDAKEAEVLFNACMNKCQADIGRVAADKKNNQTHSEYASYAALDRVVRPVYTKWGFSLSFNTEPVESETVRVLCYVSHENGHTRNYSVDMPADGKGAKGGDVMTKTHAAGSAMQYGQRYLLKLIFNVAIGTDDDGNAASAPPISEAYCQKLEVMLDETGADIDKFKQFFGINFIKELPSNRFDEAIRMLQKKRANEDS